MADFSVVFSQRAENRLDEMVEYLTANSSPETKMSFLADLSQMLYRISQMPYLYPASRKKEGVRKCILNKRTLIYYRVQPEKQQIEIITIQDASQNPSGF